MTRLNRLLRPRHIAVLGAGWAQNVIEQCAKMGFSGQVWPVHPTKTHIGGFPAYASLADLPEAPDATFIGVNRHATIGIVGELAAMGAGGAICFASGWTEAGEPGLQAELVAAAGGEMPILGPNCYGVINYLDGALLWPDQHGGVRVDRGVALISQSSNIVINMGMQKRALPVAYVACLGNAAVVGLAGLAGAMLDDPRVTALGLYVEGIDDAAGFAALAQRARAMGKGIVCIKSGKTELSQTAAASHTASLAGGGAASSAFLRQIGVAEVNTPSELIETLKIMHMHGGLGPRICSLSCSGGEAGLVADLAAPFGIDFPPVPEDTKARLNDILGPIVTVANPLDYHTFIWGDGPRTTDVFTTMLQAYDAGIYIIDPPRPDRCDPASYEPALAAIEAAQAATGKPAIPVALLPENFDEARAMALMARGTCTLMGLETALAAIRAAQTPAGDAGWLPLAVQAPRGAVMLDEAASKAMLAAAGVAVPKRVTAVLLADLDVAGLAGPFALKGLGFAHKTEAGAVRLGLTTLAGQAEMAGATGYLAEEMVQGVVAELLVGLRRDPVYGATLTLGFGGITTELLADTVTLVCPVTGPQVAAALGRLRLWPMLDGYRGKPAADVAAVVEAVQAVQGMLADTRLQEVEINPLMACQKGAVAVDAVIWRGQ